LRGCNEERVVPENRIEPRVRSPCDNERRSVSSGGRSFLSEQRELRWFNTNKLLDVGFTGIKTGHTDVAGPCLASSVLFNDQLLICVALNCDSLDSRFSDTLKLVNWYRKQ
jgi:D-alanyl-D-alanine carboxypeptidase